MAKYTYFKNNNPVNIYDYIVTVSIPGEDRKLYITVEAETPQEAANYALNIARNNDPYLYDLPLNKLPFVYNITLKDTTQAGSELLKIEYQIDAYLSQLKNPPEILPGNDIEQVKREVTAHLDALGYNGQETADFISEITGYYNGKPSQVKLNNGVTMYL